MTIETLMQSRAALTAQIEATPLDQPIDEAFGARWEIEESVLSCTALTLDEIKAQLRILAGRAADGLDVADELERLSTS